MEGHDIADTIANKLAAMKTRMSGATADNNHIAAANMEKILEKAKELQDEIEKSANNNNFDAAGKLQMKLLVLVNKWVDAPQSLFVSRPLRIFSTNSLDSAVVASDGGPPPAKRARGSNVMLMPELWASVLAYLAFDDAKECSAINRFFLSAVAPLVIFRPDVTVKITLPPTVWVETVEKRNNDDHRVGRFRGIKKVRIEPLEYETVSGTRAILRSFDGLSSIVARGLNSKNWNQQLGEMKNWNQQLGEKGAVDVELARAFAPVRDTLRKLDLELYPQVGVTKALQSLRGLTHLRLAIPNADDMDVADSEWWWSERWGDGGRYNHAMAFGRSLGELGALPHLQVLTITDDDNLNIEERVAAAVMAGCSQIKSLRVLRSAGNDDWSNNSDNSAAKVFATMLSNLTNLEEINVKVTTPHLLQEIIVKRGGGQQLKRLSCDFLVPTIENVNSLVSTILGHFTSLASVAIELSDTDIEDWPLEEAMQTLSTLRGHPHLKRLDFYIEEEPQWCFSRLRELLVGSQVKVHLLERHLVLGR